MNFDEIAQDDPRIIDVASHFMHRGNKSEARFFKPSERGAYNNCFFIEFPTLNGAKRRVVVRVTRLHENGYPLNKKLQAEVAIMRIVRERTMIPVPEVYGFGTEPEHAISGINYFIVLEFVEGYNLAALYRNLRAGSPPINPQFPQLTKERQDRLLEHMADVFAQFRRLEFDAAGTLGFAHTPSPVD
ncbi:uncharacterized protein MKZ38_010391 [Zalerion maritima]|uniref:Aminoglycoside phosphotransferase domain-containing protein n=1 Tax=Zalerion maritima TaxID=339359 RepID=A0AAD5RU75_9PEZI|nr:uncharacterized protein MKZ38_010391 [Zalerion maritima]